MQEQLEKQKQALKPPSLYNVIMHNDDYTPFEFVALVLIKELGKSSEEAYTLTVEIHVNGKATVGVYPRDIAETKANKCIAMATAAQYPLKTEAILAE